MSAMVLSLCLAIPAGVLFKYFDIALRRRNIIMVHLVDAWVKKGKDSRIPLLMYSIIFLTFILSFVFYLILLFPGYYTVHYLLNHLPAPILQGLRFASEVLPLLGIVVAMQAIHFKPGEAISIYKKSTGGKQKQTA